MSAAHARSYTQRLCRAVSFARTAFDTGVAIDDCDLAVVARKDSARADIETRTAANTEFRPQLQRHHVLEVYELSHV